MAKNNNEYSVKIKADITDLKQDVRRELKKVLDETEHISKQIGDGLTPDTTEFEHRLSTLEKSVKELGKNCSSTKELVSSMKTAFADFVKVQGVMNGQTKQMLDLFDKMTPKTRELFNTFITTHADDAMEVLAKAVNNVGVSTGVATDGLKNMQKTAQQAANATKNSLHEIETEATNGVNAINGVVETTAHSINNIKQETKEAIKELERLQGVRKSYNSDKDYKGTHGQSSLRKEIDSQRDIFRDSQGIFEEALESGEDYNKELIEVIENGQKLLSLLDKLDESNLSSKKYKNDYKNAAETDVKNYLKQYKDSFSVISAEISKVELKPLKLKVDLANDDEIIEQINKALDRIKDNVKINPIKIPLNFTNQEVTEETNKQVKKTKKKKKTTEEVNIEAVKSSFEKEIESIQKSFEKIKQPLQDEVKQWRNNLEEYLTLEFKWKKGNKEGIIDLFDDINRYAETNPIWLNPDTDKLIAEIEAALTQHKFKLDLSSSNLNLSSGASGAIPVTFVGGTGTPMSSMPIRQNIGASTSTIKTETKKETASVDKNSKVVEKNSDVILDVINEFKTYSKSGNETINKAEKTIQKLLSQNEKLDKNNPQDAEKITANNERIKKVRKKIADQKDRFSVLYSRTGVDVQNISSIDDDTLYQAVLHLVQDRNEIVDVLNTTKIGGASNSKTFLTKGIRNLVDSISNAQQALNVEMKEADTVSKEIAAKDYLKDAEQLSRMGMVLKTANREIRENAVPTEDALQEVINVFSGTGEGRYKSRNLDSVTRSAQNLKDVLGQYDELLSADGGYQQYVNRLNDEIEQIQSEISELSKHPRKNKTAIADKKSQLTEKVYELSEIRENVEPVLNEFKNSIKGLPGQIADQLKGYKFIVEFVDANGKKVTESFNDASARAPENTEPYYKRSTKMFDRINAGEITSITPKSTPNDSVFTLLYGDKISKSTAIQQVIDAYNQLDKKAREYVDTLIDINKLTDENLTVSQKFDNLENSYIFDRNNKEGIVRSKAANHVFEGQSLNNSRKAIRSNIKTLTTLDPEKDSKDIEEITKQTESLQANIKIIKKANAEANNFIDTVVSSYFSATSSIGLGKRTQKLLQRGSTISYGSSKDATVSHPEERDYNYSAADRKYRTHIEYEGKSVEELNQELSLVNTKLAETSEKLDGYKNSLQQAEEAQKEERKRLDTTAERAKLKEKYPEITDQQSFSEKFTTAESFVNKSRTSVKNLQSKVSAEKNTLDELSSQFKENESAITAIQSRVNEIKKAGGVEKYIEKLTNIMLDAEGQLINLAEADEYTNKKLAKLEKDYADGKISKDNYQDQKKEIDNALRENQIDREKARATYENAKNERYSSTIGTTKVDKSTGQVVKLTDSEYYANRQEEINQIREKNNEIEKNIQRVSAQLSEATASLKNAQNQVSASEADLEQLKRAFAEEYLKYINEKLQSTSTQIEDAKKSKATLDRSYASANEQVKTKKSSVESHERLVTNAKTEKEKSIYTEQLKQARQEYDEATNAYDEAKDKSERITKILHSLQDEHNRLSQEKNNTEKYLKPDKTTPQDDIVQKLKKDIRKTETEVSALQTRQERLTGTINDIKNGVSVKPSSDKIDTMSDEQKKTYALREIEKIDSDLKLADKKIDAAEKKKKDISNRIKVLQKKGAASSEVRISQNQATAYAEQTAKGTDEYKDFQRELHEQFTSGAITWDEYSTKIQEKIDEIVAKLKEAEPDKYTGKSAEELEAILKKEKKVYQDSIKEAKAKKNELQEQKQAAIEFAKLSDEELTTQRAITEEKKKQVNIDKQESVSINDQNIETRIEEKSNQVNDARIQEIDNEVSRIDDEISQLKAEVKSEPKKKKSTKGTKKLTDKQQAKVDDKFLDYVSQIKAKEINNGINVKDIDLSEAINMQKQLNALAEQGNQNTEEYLALQRKLSELISKRTNQLKGTGRNGYATHDEKYEWIKTNVSEDVANFYSSDQYVAQPKKFDAAVAKTLGNSLVKDFSNEFKAQCVTAVEQAYDTEKAKGGTDKSAKKVAMRVVQQLIDSVEQGVTEGVVEESKEPTSDIASKKARIKELTKRKTQLQAEKDSIISQSSIQQTELPYSTTPLSADQMAVQAGTVIIGGSDGSGPWARETTLGATNEILNAIKSKIDTVNGNSNSSDNSSTNSVSNKKKKSKIDVDTARNTLYQAADENIATSFGEGTKSVRRFNEDTLKLYETLTLANGETVKFTYSINKMDGTVKSSYTTIANFEKVAKQAYTELGKNQIATKQMFDGLNFPEEKVTAYNNAITALDSKLKSLGNKGVTDPSDAAEVEVLTGNVKKLRTELEGMAKSSAKLANQNDLVKTFDTNEISDVKAQMKALAQETYGAGIIINGFNEETNELIFSAKTGKNELTTLTYKFDELTNSIYKTGSASKTTTGFFKSFFSDVGRKVAELARYYTGMSLLTEAFQRVRQGVQYIRDIDIALTELKKVTDESESSYHRFLQTMSETASVVGSTVSELTNSAAAWARLGYSMEEAGELAKNTAILLNVSEFESEEQATEALISSLQAFNYEANESIKIVDKLNIIGNNFAISSDGIAEGLSRSASTLVAAGNTLEESIAMLAAGNKVQQDPEGLGNALKVLSMRIRGTKTDLEEAGEETEGMIENTSKLQAKVKALTDVDGSGGVDILTDSGAYKSTYQILLEIAEVWDRINESDPKNQAALLEILAGKTRGSQVASILQNPEDLKDAYSMALDSDGSAQKELETYLNSIQGRIDLFTNELQTFWMNLINSNVIKLVVDAGTTILEVLNGIMNAIDKVAEGWGSLGVIIPTAIGAFSFGKFKKDNNIKDIYDLFTIGSDKIKNIEVVKNVITSYKNAINDMSSSASKIKGVDLLAELANFDDASGQLGTLTQLLDIKDEATEVSKEFVEAMLKEHAAELGLNDATIQSVLSSELFTGAQTGAAVSTNIFTAAITKLKAAMTALWTALGPVGVAIIAITSAIAIFASVYNKFFSHDAHVKKLENITKELEEIQSRIKSLNDEIETTKDRIEELENKGPLTLTEQEELEKLKAQNAELERQIQLEEAREKRAINRQAEQAADTFDKDSDFKAQVDSNTGLYLENKFEQKLDSIEIAKENLESAEIALQNAINSGMDTESRKFKKLEDNLTSAQEDYSKAYSNWDEFMKNKESEYNGLQWFNGDNLTKSQKKVNDIISSLANYNDRAEIMFGSAGAKESALDRVFGEHGSEAGKIFLEEFNAQVNAGKIDTDVSGLDDYSTAIDNVTNSVEDLMSKNPQLKLQLDTIGISTEDVARYFLNIDEVMQQTSEKMSIAATDIASLTSIYESYASVLSMANEAIYEGQAISDEYYESLKEYLVDVTIGEEDFSDAIDTNNGKIIKNAKLLKDLISQKKKDQKATVNAAKAQSQLQYSKIVKQLQQAVKAMALDYKTYGYVTQATYQNISALRDQISAIKNAIREYALLELKLSDVTNAYSEFEAAKERDAELTYGDSLVEGIQALNDGFATGKVGSETFKAALDLIIPPEAYESLDDYQDRLVAMHDYVDKNPLFADWFTVDEDGNYGIEFKNMAAFVQDMQNMGVFTGDDITGFNFSDGINSIEDIVAKTKDFNDGIGATESTIVAMLSELSKYDARFGDLLSEITMTEADRTLKKTTEALDKAIAKQEQFFKDGKDPYGADGSEYNAIQQEINNCSDAYNKAQKAIIDNTNAWIDANNNVDIAKNKVADLTRELQELKDSDTATETEIKIKTDELEVAKKELSDALQIKYKLGEEPTQMDFQLTLDDVQSQIDKWKEENAVLDVDVVPNLKQDKNGVWTIPAEIEAELSEDDKKKIQEYVDLINDEQGLASLLGLVETDPAVSELVQIKDIISEIAKKLGVSTGANTERVPVKDAELHGNTPSSDSKKETSTSSDTSASTKQITTSPSAGFSDWSSDIQIAAANEALEKWASGIEESAIELKDSLSKFFTETLPEKWDEFWAAVGEQLDDIEMWAQDAGVAIDKFFTETLPEEWSKFWDGVGNFFESIPYAVGYFAGKVKIFFTETVPTKWNEFWNGVGSTLDSLKEDATILKDKIVDFFIVTIPQKWNEFWDKVTIFMSETAPDAIDSVRDKIIEFFTVTIPTKWNAFWDSVSEYISTNITPALSAFCDKVVEFFTITIPEKWNGFWDSVGTFFGETIPTALENTQAEITTFFTVTLPEKWSEFWGGVSSWFGEKINEFLGFLSSIKNKFKTGYEDATSGNEYGASKESGASGARGNALAKGNAHSKSDVGLKNKERNAVVGELGRELVVDPNKGVYYTVGENGTEMVDLPKGAIIYNHKQTEELLKNGYTSRGKYTGGLSFAKGNAYPTPSNSDGYNHGLFGGYLSDNAVFKDTSKQWVDANKDWVNDFANAADGIIDAADSLSDSANDASDAFEDVINWIDVLFTRIENNIAEQEAYLETLIDTSGVKSLKDSVYNNIYGQLYSRASASIEARNYYRQKAETEMSGLSSDIQNKIRNGAIQIQEFKGTGNEEADKALEKQVEKINKAIEYYDKISEYEQQYYTTITEIADKAVEHQEDVANGYENEIGLVEHLNNSLEARNDLLATKEGFAAKAYYDAQIDANEIMLGQLKDQRDAMQDVLDEEVRLGHVKIGSQQWFDMQQAIYDVDDAIIDTMASIEDLQNSINDLHWEKFDELINRFGYLEDEIGNVVQLLSHDPDGLIMEELRDLTSDNWATGSGLTTIGMYAQEMERAKYVANEYADAIKELEKNKEKYNDTEYLAKLNELTSAQYENIEKYYDAKDAIVELNRTRVDAIRDGIEKEIDAYQELINKKKELLDSEQDLHDFQNEISDKEKEVSDIRKQLAAMDGDTSAATVAKKKQLEAELVNAQKSLEESYYSHSISSRQEALDKEFSSFEEEKNEEIKKWEDWLENTEAVVDEALTYVKDNTKLIYEELTNLGNQYNLTLVDYLTTPWANGQTAIDSYSANFTTAVSDFTTQLDNIVLAWEEVTLAAEEAARVQAKALQQEYEENTQKIKDATTTQNTNTLGNPPSTPPSNPPSSTPQNQQDKKSITVGGKIKASGAQIYDYKGDMSGESQYYGDDPIYTVLQEQDGWLQVRYHKLSSGITGWFKKSDVEAYATGTLGTKKDQLALIDELGDELIIHTNGKGRLSYLSKGSGVVPADLTENLMDIAEHRNALMSMIEDRKQKFKVPNISTNNFDMNLSFDSLVHVDNCSQDTVPTLQKMVRAEFNNMMKQVNNGLKRVQYTK